MDKGVGYKLKETESLEEGSKFFIGGKECEVRTFIIFSNEHQIENFMKIIMVVFECPNKLQFCIELV